MPFYEEKVISPFAVRFTQQRIRETFKDGHKLEGTIEEIKVLPGVGDYDLVLAAPFPTIEIIRWAPNGRNGGEKAHWFSYDNRRLYCLQRVAAEYWPKRVGANVEVLYADSGAIRKKLDSRTGGLSVSIGHAFASDHELQQWSWQKAVQERAPPGNFGLQAKELVIADDAKSNVCDLTDASAARLSSENDNLGTKSCVLPASSATRGGACIAGRTESCSAEEQETQVRATSPTQTSQFGGDVLTGLIAQLMDLKAKEHLESHSKLNEDGNCVQPSEGTGSTDSDIGAADSANNTLCSSSDASSELESAAASDSEEKPRNQGGATSDAEQKLVAAQHGAGKECFASVVQQKSSGKKPTKADPKQSKKSQNSKTAQTNPAVNAAQAAQVQMAQWQVAQWQAAQIAQWQHARMAYHANQDARMAYQANQAAKCAAYAQQVKQVAQLKAAMAMAQQ